MKKQRADYIKCIRRTHVDLIRSSWCGRQIGFEWCFVDVSHAAENGAQAGRLVACPDCVASVQKALSNGHEPAADPDVRLTKMNVRATTGEPVEAWAQFEGGAVKAWAASLVQWFRESGGQNYVTCDLRDPTTGEAYQITMQKAGGRTPAQDICELRAQANRQAESTVPMPRMIWDACSQGGLWKCDRTGCDAAYCSPPWSREGAAKDHQDKCTALKRLDESAA